MKKFYSILFCLMAMSITFSSCSKGGDDDFLPNGGGTEVNGGSTQSLTSSEIGELNVAYNSGNTSEFIKALESKGCIAKPQPTRSGDSDGKYVLTDKGEKYFGHDLFKDGNDKMDEKYAYRFMCFVFQGIYIDGDRNIQEDMYGKYRWVSLDDTNVWLECTHKEVNYDEEFVITWHKDGEVLVFNFKDNRQIVNFDNIELSIREDLAYEYYIRDVSNDEPLIFSQVRGSDAFYMRNGKDYTSSKDNICIVNISTEHKYDIVQGLYIRVPKTNN